jgi:hypothetical protein
MEVETSGERSGRYRHLFRPSGKPKRGCGPSETTSRKPSHIRTFQRLRRNQNRLTNWKREGIPRDQGKIMGTKGLVAVGTGLPSNLLWEEPCP